VFLFENCGDVNQVHRLVNARLSPRFRLNPRRVNQANPQVLNTNPHIFDPTNNKQETSILNILIEQKKNNKSIYTIQNTNKKLTQLAKYSDLNNPEAIKLYIAELKVRNGTKMALCEAYNNYCKHYKIEWEKPIYRPEAQDIKLPTKEKILMLIADAGKTLTLKLQISMATGLRPIELTGEKGIRPRDFDPDQHTIRPTTAKQGAPRTLTIPIELSAKLQTYIIQHKIPLDEPIFKGKPQSYSSNYRDLRNKLAKKLNDQTMQTIRLYDLRHYFCTKKLNDIGNPYTVMCLMGHKKIETTQKYMHLLNLADDEWNCAGATTKNEAIKLIEAGFQYVTTIEGIQLFKKRK
jgi:integrase